MLAPEEIDRRDKHNSAIHEAGHVVVAAVTGFGCQGASLKRRTDVDPRTEKTWHGQTHFLMNLDLAAILRDQAEGRTPKEHVRKLPAAVAVAGMVAEKLFSDLGDADATAQEIINEWQDALNAEKVGLSPTDMTDVSDDWGDRARAIAEAHRILLQQRQFFDRVVAFLVNFDGLTEQDLRKLWQTRE